jgi:hypothetical protein
LANAPQILPATVPLLSDGETKHNRPDPAAMRALAEAEERRRRTDPPPPREINGREGPEPVRYGDWEVRGLASDF